MALSKIKLELEFRTEPRASDVEAVRSVVSSSPLFSEEEVVIAVELVADRLCKGPSSSYQFLFAEKGDELLAYCCFGRIAGTNSSYDIYWIAVLEGYRDQGLGRRLLEITEATVCCQGGTQVFVDTAGRRDYHPTRRFYESCGYEKISEIPDFFSPGDDKVIYRKILSPLDL